MLPRRRWGRIRRWWNRIKGRARHLAHWVRHPRLITCLECGFLALGTSEVSEADRFRLASRGSTGYPPLDQLCCARSLWVEYDLMYVSTNADALFKELEADRRGCSGFLRHRKGWRPSEHKDLLSKALETRQKIRFTIFGAILGLLVTLLATWISRLLGS